MKSLEELMVESLERKGCKFNDSSRTVDIPFDERIGGCVALGNRSWGRVNALCHKYGWSWQYLPASSYD